MRITLTVVAIITVLPSIYLAYRIVGDSLTESSVQKYIASEFSFDDTQVVRSSADTKAKEIRVALLGKRLSEGAHPGAAQRPARAMAWRA